MSFGVVPEETRALKPEMAPQAIVMKQNGNTLYKLPVLAFFYRAISALKMLLPQSITDLYTRFRGYGYVNSQIGSAGLGCRCAHETHEFTK
jgi:hypothetical protein